MAGLITTMYLFNMICLIWQGVIYGINGNAPKTIECLIAAVAITIGFYMVMKSLYEYGKESR